jgi:hypothetical protein
MQEMRGMQVLLHLGSFHVRARVRSRDEREGRPERQVVLAHGVTLAGDGCLEVTLRPDQHALEHLQGDVDDVVPAVAVAAAAILRSPSPSLRMPELETNL